MIRLGSPTIASKNQRTTRESCANVAIAALMLSDCRIPLQGKMEFTASSLQMWSKTSATH